MTIQAGLISRESSTIISKIDPGHDILINIPIRKRHNVTQKFPPLVTLQCDSEHFVSQIRRDWTQYTDQIQARPSILPLYLRPECDSFHYRHFQWTPEYWNRLKHLPAAKQFSFEMIYFDITDKPLYVIRNANHSSLSHNMYLFDSSDTILFISKVISYFYELYQFVKFRLQINDSFSPQMQREPCFVALERLPNIKLPLHTFGTRSIPNPHQCSEERLVRFRQTSPSAFLVEFPQGQVQNLVPIIRNYKVYKETTGHPDVLDFQWTNPHHKSFLLQIEVGQRLTANPKLWWIHRQSSSVLGYHDNFFAPESLRTSQVVYSYARGRYHYYANGLYVTLPNVNYLLQNVTERNYTLQKWPLPERTENRPLNLSTVCSPHIGSFERALIKATTLLPNNQQLANINFCQHTASDLLSLPFSRQTYHEQALTENPHFSPTFYSYYDDPTPFKELDTFTQIVFNHEVSILTPLWQNIHSKILQLHQKLNSFHYFFTRSSYYSAERRIYSHDTNMKFFSLAWAHEIDNRDKATQNLNELNHLVNYFAVTLPSIRQRFRALYLLKLRNTVLPILRNYSLLRPGILYKHIFTNGRLHSIPYKRNRHFTALDFTETISTTELWPTAAIDTTFPPQSIAPISSSSQTFLKTLTLKNNSTPNSPTDVFRSLELTTSDYKPSHHSTFQSRAQHEKTFFYQNILNFFGSHSINSRMVHVNFRTHVNTSVSHTPLRSTHVSQTQNSTIHSRRPLINEQLIIHSSLVETSVAFSVVPHEVPLTLFIYCFSMTALRSLLVT